MRVSMSKLGLLRQCQFFARPEVKWVRDESGPAAQFGSAVHDIVAASFEQRATGGDARAMDLAATYLEWHAEKFAAAPTGWIAEPAYVFDAARGSARLIGTNIGRAYPELATAEIAGSADLVLPGIELVLIDVKTGRRENVDPIERNEQMRTLALAASRAHGAAMVHAILAFVGPSGVVTDEAVFDSLDLAAHAHDLRQTVAAIPTSEPTPGKHCAYCPARAACPATTTALAEVTPRTRLPIVTRSEDFTSAEHAREQYLTLRAAKAVIAQAWDAVHAYMAVHGPIDLGDGRQYASRQSRRETISLESRAAVEVLRNELGAAWDLAVSLSTSKSAIEDAAREVAKQRGEKIVAVKNRTLDALRAVGAVNTNISQTYEEV